MNLARCFSIATALLVSMPAPSADRHFTTISSAAAAESSGSESDSVPPIQALIPEIEAYIGAGMRAFDVPGLAIGIIANDRLVYSKGFGVRRKDSGEPVETRT